jgi:hypothetical protein
MERGIRSLKGERIPLPPNTAVADAFDAMTEDRVTGKRVQGCRDCRDRALRRRPVRPGYCAKIIELMKNDRNQANFKEGWLQ